MPELARFYGIIIRMFVEVGERHHRPHFHAISPNGEAVFALDDLAILAAPCPRANGDWSKPGPNCIALNSRKTGLASSPARGLCPSNRCVNLLP
jgi:hypothetical protein